MYGKLLHLFWWWPGAGGFRIPASPCGTALGKEAWSMGHQIWGPVSWSDDVRGRTFYICSWNGCPLLMPFVLNYSAPCATTHAWKISQYFQAFVIWCMLCSPWWCSAYAQSSRFNSGALIVVYYYAWHILRLSRVPSVAHHCHPLQRYSTTTLN